MSDRRILMMSKEEMMENGTPSPDCADALSQCFGAVDIDRPTVSMTAEARELLEHQKNSKQNALVRL